MSRKDALGPALATIVLLLVVAPAAATAADCAHSGDLVTALSAPDRRAALLCVIDAERAARDLPLVRESAQLERAAQGHADDMVARHFFEHVTPGGSTLGDRVHATGYIAGRPDWELGEAIAWAQQPLDTPVTLMRAWLASPEHRANLLRAGYKRIGIGIARGTFQGYDGATIVTADFAG